MLEHLNKYKIILASNSPRRKELLNGLDIPFETRVIVNIKEDYPSNITGADIAEYLATQKAKHYNLQENELLITADTIVVLHDETMLGKPKDREEAVKMLRLLSGQTHKVATGVCIKTNKNINSFIDISEVEFDILSNEEISYYIDKYEPFDKAGSYGVQEWIGYIGVKNIRGSHFNIMGLPVQKLYSALKNIV